MKNIFNLLIVIFTTILSSCSKSDDTGTTPSVPDSTVVIFADQVQAAIQKNISFSLTGNLPPDIANINWDFGEGPIFYGNNNNTNVYHQFQSTGTYLVKSKIIRQNGTIIESTKTINIVNSNIVKVNKITILSYPTKSCRKFVFYSNGVSGYWSYFFGEWDESEGLGSSTSLDRFSDTYLTLSKNQDIPNSTNPSNLVQDVNTLFYTTSINLNQQNNVFDVSAQNIILSLNGINNFEVKIMDSDVTKSLYEDGLPNDIVGIVGVIPSSFQNNSFIYTAGSVQIKIDYTNIN
jgi:hypothetical protein